MRDAHLLLSSVGRRRLTSRRMPESLTLSAPVFAYLTEGRGTVRVDEEAWTCGPNELLLLSPGRTYDIRCHTDMFEVIFVIADVLRLSGRRSDRRLTACPVREAAPWLEGRVRLETGPDTPAALRSLLEKFRSGGGRRSPLALQTAFEQWVSSLRPERQPSSVRPDSDKPDDGIALTVDYMRAHYAGKIKLETLAEMSGFTPTSYSREFKRVMGVSPIDYLNRLRIERAKRVLLEEGGSVKQASAASGFGNEFYFSRMFKRSVGLSPAMYARRHNVRVAVASCFRYQDSLRSLGVEPVYAANCYPPKTMGQTEHRRMLHERLREMSAAAPELIICDHYHQPFVDELRRIAPTIVCNIGMDWKALHLKMAELVGREMEAQRNIEGLERTLKHAKPLVEARFGGRSVTFMRVIHKLVRIQGAAHHPLNELLYGDLGLKPGYCVPANTNHIEYSPDKLPDLDTDLLFVQRPFFHSDDEALYRRLQRTPEWLTIRAVRDRQVRQTGNWIGLSWSPSGRIDILNELLNEIGN